MAFWLSQEFVRCPTDGSIDGIKNSFAILHNLFSVVMKLLPITTTAVALTTGGVGWKMSTTRESLRPTVTTTLPTAAAMDGSIPARHATHQRSRWTRSTNLTPWTMSCVKGHQAAVRKHH